MPGRNRPPVRDLEIYQAVYAQGATMEEVARAYQLTKGRICQICKRIDAYQAQFPQEHLGFLTLPQRAVHLRNRVLDKLDHSWREAMKEWRDSRQSDETFKVGTDEPTSEGGRGGRRKAEHTRRRGRGHVASLRLACSIAQQVFKIEGGSLPPVYEEPPIKIEATHAELSPEEERRRDDWAWHYFQRTRLEGTRLEELARQLGYAVVPLNEPVPALPLPQAEPVPQPEVP